MSNEVKLGGGKKDGMFFHAPKGTALPASLSGQLPEAWKEVGFVSEDGITIDVGMSFEELKDWSKTTRRVFPGEGNKTVSVPVISTTEESLKTIFGSDNVVATKATGSTGNLVKLSISDGYTPEPEAFLFLMKDGEDLMMYGTSEGYITAVDSVSFTPGNPITWTATIAGNDWVLMTEDGAQA